MRGRARYALNGLCPCVFRACSLANPSFGYATGIDEPGQLRARRRGQIEVGVQKNDRLLFEVVVVKLVQQLVGHVSKPRTAGSISKQTRQ